MYRISSQGLQISILIKKKQIQAMRNNPFNLNMQETHFDNFKKLFIIENKTPIIEPYIADR